MSRLRIPFVLVIAGGLVACTQQGQKASEPVELDGPRVYFVVGTTTAFVQPTTAATVEHATTGQTVSNIKGTLMRGTRIDVTQTQGAFAWGEWDLGAVGWVPLIDLIPGKGGSLATAAEPLEVRSSPGADTAAAEIPAGTLLILLEHSGSHSRVNYDGRHDGWVQSAALLSARDDVGVSQLLAEMRYSATHDMMTGPTYSYVNKARRSFPESKLLTVIREQAETICVECDVDAPAAPPAAPQRPQMPLR